jgi:hypothetical protein
VDETYLPHKAHLKIACLEMEKARRGKERQSATRRIESIDARCREIAAAKAALVRELSEQNSADFKSASDNAPKPAPRRTQPGFRLRY